MGLKFNLLSCLFVLLVFLEFKAHAQSQTCTCPGAQVQVSSHNFCFQIQHSSNSTWADADQKCLSLGGFLAHLDSDELIDDIKSYVQSNYQLPLLTGGLLGNSEYQLIAMMCPNNTFMNLLNTSIASEIINNATNTNGSCLFLQNSDYKLHYGNCNSTYDILCQIPMDDTQTCGVMMQCKSSSTRSASNSSTLAQGTTTSRPASSNSSSGSSGSQNSSQSSQQRTKTTISAASNASTASTNQSTSKFANNSATTPKTSSNSSVSSGNTTPNVQNNGTATTTSSTSNLTGLSSTAMSFLSSISTGSTKSSSSQPSNSTGTTPYWSASQPGATGDTFVDGCDTGYTKLGRWCFPWWAWLVFGLLVFLVLFTLAICLVFMCVGGRKKKVSSSENYERLSNSTVQNNEYSGQQVRPSSEPPSSIYENRHDGYLAPSPYSAPNNHSPVYI
ncbi:hypothetical protein M3Y97_01048100 [Aphelenchoides bicaudatus]|nr:hypothetical protein M3Y97_01048100 [Aphelenchoides bicaudatus]